MEQGTRILSLKTALIVVACSVTLFMVVSFVVLLFGTKRGMHPSSLGQLLSIGSALQLYAEDNNDHLPPADKWMDATQEYLPNVDAHRSPYHPDRFGFAFFRPLSHAALSDISNPESQVVVYDSTDPSWNANDRLESLPAKGVQASGNYFLFLDWHPRWYSMKDGGPLDSRGRLLTGIREPR